VRTVGPTPSHLGRHGAGVGAVSCLCWAILRELRRWSCCGVPDRSLDERGNHGAARASAW